MYELTPDQFSGIHLLYQPLSGCIPLQGILEKRHAARIFVDQPRSPSCAFTWTRWGHFYLAGADDNREFVRALQENLDSLLLPASKALGESTFILWTDRPAWENRLPDLLPGRSPLKIFRRTFDFDPATFYEGRYSRPVMPPGFALQPIDAALLEKDQRLAAEILTAWASLDDFVRDGAGACLMDGEQLASACFSLFLGRGMAEVNVFTAEEYRRRGFAILTTAGFIDACLKRGLRPNWECFWDNLPSLRLAENLGFKAKSDIPVYYWEEPSAYVNI
jgi:GNAT superfamily N-acetyltransferase